MSACSAEIRVTLMMSLPWTDTFISVQIYGLTCTNVKYKFLRITRVCISDKITHILPYLVCHKNTENVAYLRGYVTPTHTIIYRSRNLHVHKY
jgi:hypothetical protein